MRILMLAQFYLPTLGGEERHVQDLAYELVKRGHDVAIATLWHQGLAEFEIDHGVRIYRIRSTSQRAGWLFSEAERRHAPPLPDPEAVWSLYRVLAAEQPEIVHAHNWLLHSFLPLKPLSNAGLVVTLHDYSFRCAKKRLMYRGTPCSGPGVLKCMSCAGRHYGPLKGPAVVVGNWMMGAAERVAVDMFLPVSHATADGNGLIGSNLPFQVIPNFVPDDAGAPSTDVEPWLAQLPDRDYLLFVGDMSRDKGLDVLLEAYGGLEDAPPLVLIGRRRPELSADFPPNVMFLNSWPHDAVVEAWRRSLIALAPSVWHEPFGIVVIEAMLAGRPVIASRTGGISDILVDGETGLLVPPADPIALRHAIKQLLADPELRERMGHASKQRVTMFQANTVVPRIEQVYQNVLESRRAAGKLRKQGDEEQGYYDAGKA